MKKYIFKLLAENRETKTWFNAPSYDAAYAKLQTWLYEHNFDDFELIDCDVVDIDS